MTRSGKDRPAREPRNAGERAYFARIEQPDLPQFRKSRIQNTAIFAELSRSGACRHGFCADLAAREFGTKNLCFFDRVE
jgi:hypothetical protein